VDDSKRFYDELQEEREKQRLVKKALEAERELEPKAQGTEGLENAGPPLKGAALQEAENLVERIKQEHTNLVAALQNSEFKLKDKDEFKLKDSPVSTVEEALKEHTKKRQRWGVIIGGSLAFFWFFNAVGNELLPNSPYLFAICSVAFFGIGGLAGGVIAESVALSSFKYGKEQEQTKRKRKEKWGGIIGGAIYVLFILLMMRCQG